MHSPSTLTRFLIGLAAFILLAVGLRLLYYGLQDVVTLSSVFGILAFVGGVICFVGGIVVTVLLFDAYPSHA